MTAAPICQNVAGLRTAAYVGILTPGSTSRMRAGWLRRLTPDCDWTWIDTDRPLEKTGRISKSLAYRFHIGSAVDAINAEIVVKLPGSVDLIWVDKAIFLKPATIAAIRKAGSRIVHFTPDTAFGKNASRYFEKSLPIFDLVVTTKSFEMDQYRARTLADRIFLTTQGFDPEVHYPRAAIESRRREAIFIGLAEPDRLRCVETLISHGVPVRLGGRGWTRFVERNSACSLLAFEGPDVFGDDYARLLSASWIGLGLVSKRFPELHTTRTFEMPACGAVLATERTTETERFFDPGEALFFDSYEQLGGILLEALSRDASQLALIADAGRERVIRDGHDYLSILSAILDALMRA